MHKSDEFIQGIIDRGGGIITLGGSLGVMVAPAECDVQCPAGWGFVAVETASVRVVRETMDAVPKNMASWRAAIEKSTTRRGV